MTMKGKKVIEIIHKTFQKMCILFFGRANQQNRTLP